MPRYLLDTDICIYIAKGRPPEVLSRFEKLEQGDLAMSVITYGELLYGAERSAKAAQALTTVDELAMAIPVLPLDANVAGHYGSIRARLAAAGTPIGNNDLWIAAHALATDLTIVTNNVGEFRRVGGLKVENWVDSGR